MIFLFESTFDRKDDIIKKIKNVIKVNKIKKIGFIEGLYVHMHSRNKGIGTDLLTKMIAKMENEGAEMILLIAIASYPNKFNLVNWYETKMNLPN